MNLPLENSPIKLSVVIITYNEELNIRRCIESVLEIADDIVVVDSYSTDDTEKICLSLGVRFVSKAYEGYIEKKNWAITQAKFPHILSLDADEALDEQLKKSILAVKQNFDFDGYYMNRLTNYCGKWIRHCGWYPDKKLRLWDSRKGTWGGTNPHDKYEMFAGDKTTSYLKGDILHYSYYNIEQHYKQVHHLTGILANSQFKIEKKAPLLKVYLSPVFGFFRSYFLKLGVLDGLSGFTVCRISAYATYLKYKKLRLLHLGKNI